jgi:hypothetical protein
MLWRDRGDPCRRARSFRVRDSRSCHQASSRRAIRRRRRPVRRPIRPIHHRLPEAASDAHRGRPERPQALARPIPPLPAVRRSRAPPEERKTATERAWMVSVLTVPASPTPRRPALLRGPEPARQPCRRRGHRTESSSATVRRAPPIRSTLTIRSDRGETSRCPTASSGFRRPSDGRRDQRQPPIEPLRRHAIVCHHAARIRRLRRAARTILPFPALLRLRTASARRCPSPSPSIERNLSALYARVWRRMRRPPRTRRQKPGQPNAQYGMMVTQAYSSAPRPAEALPTHERSGRGEIAANMRDKSIPPMWIDLWIAVATGNPFLLHGSPCHKLEW